MTKTTDVREALAALLYACEEILLYEDNSRPDLDRFEAAKIAARAALAEQPATPSAQPEPSAQPVAWKIITVGGRTFFEEKDPADNYAPEWLARCRLVQPLYAAPPQPAAVPIKDKS